jgi:hypothetical protein
MAVLSRYVRQPDGTWEEDFCLREVPTFDDTDPDLIIVELGESPPPLPDTEYIPRSERDTIPDI